MVLLLLLSLLFQDTSGKLPPPEFSYGACHLTNEQCYTRIIKTKVYIEDDLWNDMDGQPRTPAWQVDWVFERINYPLENLDNGGFRLQLVEPLVKLNESDVVLGDTYVDRRNNNKTTQHNIKDIFSHTFLFQEAVQKLKNKDEVDLRILFIKYRGGQVNRDTYGAAEENCICNKTGFACIAVFKIWDPSIWIFYNTIYTHEIGHTLGMDAHDDEFYSSNPDNDLIMWSSVGGTSKIWSPEAKKRINRHDSSCLKQGDTFPEDFLF